MPADKSTCPNEFTIWKYLTYITLGLDSQTPSAVNNPLISLFSIKTINTIRKSKFSSQPHDCFKQKHDAPGNRTPNLLIKSQLLCQLS